MTSFPALKNFVRPRKVVERCDLCSLELAPEHQHLLAMENRQISCACDACSILFSDNTKRFRRVPRRGIFLPDFRLTDEQWNSLMLPIQLAFFFNASPEGKIVALYPSPAGAMESLLTFDTWQEIAAENAILQKMEADVEALLVNRVGDKREYFIAPIDECYKLVGIIRANWRGFSGGTEAWGKINDFFAELKNRSRVIGEVANA